MPYRRWKALVNCAWSENPLARAISTSELSLCIKAAAASSNLRARRRSPGVQPTKVRKARARCTGWTPMVLARSPTWGVFSGQSWINSRAAGSQGGGDAWGTSGLSEASTSNSKQSDSALSCELSFQRTHSISNAQARPQALPSRMRTASGVGRSVSNSSVNCVQERETVRKLPVPCRK